MDLNLKEKLSPEEIVEIRKRVFSFADQMFMEGISIGRSLDREDFQSTTEDFVRDKISAMTEYFVRDDLWKAQPPIGYNPDPNVDLPEPSHTMRSSVENSIDMAEDPGGNINDVEHEHDEFKEEKPEWANQKRPFD